MIREANIQLGFKMDERTWRWVENVVWYIKMRLMSNNPKTAGLKLGLRLLKRFIEIAPNPHNESIQKLSGIRWIIQICMIWFSFSLLLSENGVAAGFAVLAKCIGACV